MTGCLSRWLFAAAVLAATPAAGAAQRPDVRAAPGPPGVVPLDGTEMLQWMLHARGIQPLAGERLFGCLARSDFGDVIVIILGEAHQQAVEGWSPAALAGVAIENGGAALIASDSELHLPFPVRRGRNIAVTGEEVFWVQRPDPAACYLAQPSCPFAVPLTPPAGPDGAGPEWELFAGLDHVATNQPSCLRLFRRDALTTPLAGFPAGCVAGHGFRPLDPNVNPFAAGSSGSSPATGQPYRFLALADPSVFINEMMVPRAGAETDNAAFAGRVVRFLQGEEPHRRRYCLFVQNGRLVDRFDALEAVMRPPPPPLPMPDIMAMQDKIADAANQFVDKLQERDVPGTAARRAVRSDLVGPALIGLGLLLVLWVLRHVWRVRQPTDVPPAPPGGRPAVPAGGAPPAGVFDRRQRELLRRNNLSEPVRAAVRELFAAAGAPPDAGPQVPRVVIADAVGRAGSLRQAVADLWKIGYGPPKVVTVQQWAGLEPLFDRVRQAHADGKWRFVAAEEGAE